MTRVVTGSRLHFGLLHVPTPGGPPIRQFGGCGLMIDTPGLAVRVEPANAWSASGPHADRALAFAKRVVESLHIHQQEPLQVTVERAPLEHVGLGLGTQLGMAVAGATLHELTNKQHEVDVVARSIGRGERSRIGVVGYRQGGFLVDGGHSSGHATPSMILARVEFPKAWRVVLVRPPVAPAWHGEAERRAFARPRDPEVALRTTERLCRLLLLGLLPALKGAEFSAFCDALFEYNRLAGEAFAADQGGVYAGPEVAHVVEKFRCEGAVGVGQSSWGPTAFAMCESDESAEILAARMAIELPGAEVAIAKGLNRGAVIEHSRHDISEPSAE